MLVLFLLVVGVYLAISAIDAWAFMLAIGIMHNDWWPAIPPMGFWTALIISMVLSIPIAVMYAVRSANDT